MVNKITCNVIRDLMPLYVDDVLSEDTKELVDEHLKSCKQCQTELEKMRKPVALPDFKMAQKQDVELIKGMHQKLRRKRIGIVMLSIFITTVVVFGGFYFLVLRGGPAYSDHYSIEPEIVEEYQDSTTSNWQITVRNLQNHPLNIVQKKHFATDKQGNETLSQVDVYVYQPILSGIMSSQPVAYVVAYPIPAQENLPQDFQCSVNFIFSDKTITYLISGDEILLQ